MSGRPRVVLASASPARLRTLRAAGLSPEVVVSGVDESAAESEVPADLALELAERKAVSVAARIDGAALVIGCDSVLELEGEAYGKPSSAGEAARRWRRMRGRTGVLHTGHCVIDVRSRCTARATESTTVEFAEVSDDEIDAYVATGEPMRVAGAFTIDGLGAAFVRRIDGDPHNVVGISLPLLRELMLRLGVHWPTLWAAPPQDG